jgi:hypothetical protein
VEPLPADEVTVNLHDLMNSLAAMIGNAQMQARRINHGSDPDLTEALATSRLIQTEGWKATNALRNLLPLLHLERPCCHVCPCPVCAASALDTSPSE